MFALKNDTRMYSIACLNRQKLKSRLNVFSKSNFLKSKLLETLEKQEDDIIS